MSEIGRYFGIGKEKSFGVEVESVFHLDMSGASLDSPAEPFIQFEGGLSRNPKTAIPASYISQGGVDFPGAVSTLWYLLWLALGEKSTSDAGVTDVATEAIGSTDGSGNLSGTLANTLVVLGSFHVDDGTDIVASDDGSGKMRDVTTIDDEPHATGAGETTLEVTLANKRLVGDGWLKIEDGATLVAHDVSNNDGTGTIVEDNASGIGGTIDYVNGTLSLTGLTASTSYDISYYHLATTEAGTINYLTGVFTLTGLAASTAMLGNYQYGYYAHTINSSNVVEMETSTIRIGKDLYEHMFKACAINSLTATVAGELIDISIDVLGGEDARENIVVENQLRLPPENPMPFHQMSFTYGDVNGALVARNCEINSLTAAINNNADAEGGLGLNSRFPCRIFSGNLDIILDLVLKFETLADKQDFWGDNDGPTITPQEKACQIVMSGGSWGSLTFDVPRMLMNTVGHAPSGRARLEQNIQLKVLFDPVTEEMITVTASVLANWS